MSALLQAVSPIHTYICWANKICFMNTFNQISTILSDSQWESWKRYKYWKIQKELKSILITKKWWMEQHQQQWNFVFENKFHSVQFFWGSCYKFRNGIKKVNHADPFSINLNASHFPWLHSTLNVKCTLQVGLGYVRLT